MFSSRGLSLLLAALAFALPAKANRLLVRDFEAPWYQPFGVAVDLDFTTINPDGTRGRCWVNGVGELPLTSCLSQTGGINPLGFRYTNWADGHWSTVANGSLKLSDLGLRTDSSQTNVVLRSNDWTNAVWTATNVTTALNQTAPDLQANTATSLTATAGNATILQTISGLGSVARVGSVFIKRLSGSGEVDFTIDNGTAWQSCTLTLNVWVRCLSAGSITSTSYTPGVRIVVNGDSVAVWDGQVEQVSPGDPKITGALAIAETADNPKLTGQALIAAGSSVPWTLLAKGVYYNPFAITTPALGDVDDGTTANRCVFRVSTAHKGTLLSTIGGVTTANFAETVATSSGSSVNEVYVCNSADYAITQNNGPLAVASTAGVIPSLSVWEIGASTTGIQWGSTLTRVSIWNKRLTNAQLPYLH